MNVLHFQRKYYISGARRYLMHEKDENLPKARRNYRRLYMLDQFIRSLVYVMIIYVIFIKFDFINKAIQMLSY